jgi:peptidyl-tRNA hydrolase
MRMPDTIWTSPLHSHAAVGLYGELLEDGEQALVERWEDHGCAKVALKVDTEEDLLELEATVCLTLTLPWRA